MCILSACVLSLLVKKLCSKILFCKFVIEGLQIPKDEGERLKICLKMYVVFCNKMEPVQFIKVLYQNNISCIKKD